MDVAALRECRVFDTLDDAEAAEIATLAERVDVVVGDVVFR